jgi:hypothetical protein
MNYQSLLHGTFKVWLANLEEKIRVHLRLRCFDCFWIQIRETFPFILQNSRVRCSHQSSPWLQAGVRVVDTVCRRALMVCQ